MYTRKTIPLAGAVHAVFNFCIKISAFLCAGALGGVFLMPETINPEFTSWASELVLKIAMVISIAPPILTYLYLRPGRDSTNL
ncbi:hypothetical protein A6E01_20090 (plasmid) [Vibrio breoganii]|uniref:Uncharacterized protein n=1 Tax=Vibrio breoganii TaxID=553239 RepID=A0AAN0XZF6_9VIBR|nr:hypothetical protein [Vibrio breoganii]ANO35516.1 hypothetical protein A6E01_20090 [Vibrio breoganii]PML13825.1 hypothetical protein BCT84_12605 [Vibrio breoganii]